MNAELSALENKQSFFPQGILLVYSTIKDFTFDLYSHYLEGGMTTLVLTDHGNLQSFMKSSHKLTNRWQVAWLEKLAAYDFEIKYRTGNTNPAIYGMLITVLQWTHATLRLTFQGTFSVPRSSMRRYILSSWLGVSRSKTRIDITGSLFSHSFPMHLRAVVSSPGELR